MAAKRQDMQSLLKGRKIELREIRLMAMSAKQSLRTEGEVLSLPTKIQQATNIKSGRGVPPSMRFAITLSLSGKYDDDTEALQIHAVYVLDYGAALDGLNDQTIHRFGEVVAVSHVWPFWREFVQASMGRMSMPPLTMPLLYPGGMRFGESEVKPRPAELKGKAKRRKKPAK